MTAASIKFDIQYSWHGFFLSVSLPCNIRISDNTWLESGFGFE